MEIFEGEAAFVVRAETKGALALIADAPGFVPELPLQKSVNRKAARQRQRVTAP